MKSNVIVIAGPNGAGKSTTAPALLKDTLGVSEFVNADVIAQGLSAFRPETAAFHAGRVMLERLHYLAAERADFAFETTLASRTFAPWIAKLKQSGYTFKLVFLSLPSADFAVARVAERVRMGGHDVPEETVRRRYEKGMRNFFRLRNHWGRVLFVELSSSDENMISNLDTSLGGCSIRGGRVITKAGRRKYKPQTRVGLHGFQIAAAKPFNWPKRSLSFGGR